MSRISLTGYMDVPAARLPAVRAALADHIALTRAEPGCLRFDVTEDLTHPGRFQVSERFATRAAFEAHQDRSTKSPWADVTAGLPRRYTVSEVTA
ncbi:antibiotic biosynthesis monooxygenase [Aliiroseovarius sp. S2029]|uniref:putative quinol monooxygenase n=1 Tax=Aliiroseovarius sp. S2029 TaxID=2936988 RepID=UPI0020BD52FE|nr:putative quinol monooxygenase [Aliiroseovarius sp. S2029]MCK8484094.1 antibiotic biosynthesis monooxygenase [Aliiroseovarius sp. S2029]